MSQIKDKMEINSFYIFSRVSFIVFLNASLSYMKTEHGDIITSLQGKQNNTELCSVNR